MDRIIESTQKCLDKAQQRLACVEDAVVDLYETPTSEQIQKIRDTIDSTIKVLQGTAVMLAQAEAHVSGK